MELNVKDFPFILVERTEDMQGNVSAMPIALYTDLDKALELRNYQNYKLRQAHCSWRVYEVYDTIEQCKVK